MSKYFYNNKIKHSHFKIKSTQLLALGFFTIIMLGAVLLTLPISVKDGQTPNFLTSLFTATSATCVTGLIVVDTFTHWTIFGQLVILCLIQIGGLGFMTVATLLSLVLRRRISLKERIVLAESISQYSVQGIVSLARKILFVTFAIEGIGATLLAIDFVPRFGLRTGIYYGIFHAVSAFCNAGFDIMGRFGQFVNLSPFIDDIYVNVIIMSLIVIGGLGFAVINDVSKNHRFKNLTVHSKLVLSVTGVLLLAGFVFFVIAEFNNPQTLKGRSPATIATAAMFQSVTTRTAGFNTMNLTGMTPQSVLMSDILMIIGGSPGSTAGGIKTATIGVIFFTVISAIKGRNDTQLFKHRLPHAIVIRAFVLAIFGLTLTFLSTIILTSCEGVSLSAALFESASAFGTVGLTLGITPSLDIVGQLTLIITMFLGRVGILTTLLAIGNRSSDSHQDFRYQKGTVTLG